MTFRTYILNRPYGFGRGNRESWTFIAAARGDPAIPDVSGWSQLSSYLETSGYDEGMIVAAKVVWASTNPTVAGKRLGAHQTGLLFTQSLVMNASRVDRRVTLVPVPDREAAQVEGVVMPPLEQFREKLVGASEEAISNGRGE